MRRINWGIQVLVAVFLVLAASTAQAAGSGVATFTLSNGLRVVIVPANTSQAVIVLRVGAGFLDERANDNPALDESGVSHELEHAMFRGTKLWPTKEQFIDALNSIGARFNASTNFERTNYFIITPVSNMEQAIALQASQIAEPVLEDGNFISEARPVSEEILRNLANPSFTLYQMSMVLHAENPRMRRLMASTSHRTLGHSPAVIRDFYNRYYSADNMTLSIVGGVDNLEQTQALLEQHYGKIKRFPVAPRASFGTPRRAEQSGQLALALDGRLPLYRVYTPATAVRMLNISFTLANEQGALASATYLAEYVKRRGQGTVLEGLYTAGLLNDLNVSVEPYRDRMILRLMVSLTETGEEKLPQVLNGITSALGSIAKAGIPDNVLEDLKSEYKLNTIQGAGLLQIAEDLTDSLADHGHQGLNLRVQDFLNISQTRITALATTLSPETMELTLLTHKVNADAEPIEGVPVDMLDMSSELPALRVAFNNGNVPLDDTVNPFLRLSETRLVQRRGVRLVVVPSDQTSQAEALLYFDFAEVRATNAQQLGAYLAIMAFEQDPETLTFLRQLRESGIDLNMQLDMSKRRLEVSVSGTAHGATLAINQLLARLSRYNLTDSGLERARATYIEQIRVMPSREVTNQALSLGMGYVESPNPAIGNGASTAVIDAASYVSSVVRQAESVSLSDATTALSVGRRRWGVSGVAKGNWSPSSVTELVQRITPASPRQPRTEVHTAALAQGTYPRLVVRDGEYDRQGVARFFPVPVAQYSVEYWAFKLFAEVLDKRLDQTVRTERGLVYAVSAGFSTLESGGSVLYMAADSSRAATQLSMAYTATLHQLLEEGMTEEEFAWASKQVTQEIKGIIQSTEGYYAMIFSGFNPRRALLTMDIMKQRLVMTAVRKYLQPKDGEPTVVDAAVMGRAACEQLLRPGGA